MQDSPVLKKQIDKLTDQNLLWTSFGLRSLAKTRSAAVNCLFIVCSSQGHPECKGAALAEGIRLAVCGCGRISCATGSDDAGTLIDYHRKVYPFDFVGEVQQLKSGYSVPLPSIIEHAKSAFKSENGSSYMGLLDSLIN